MNITALGRVALKSVVVITVVLLTACTMPKLENRNSSQAITTQEGSNTLLGKALTPLIELNPELSGVVPLSDSLDAFAARMLLIENAQKTIDIQYYIWRNDITGNLLLHALHDASKRNVRVRLLIDDNGTAGLDGKLALLNAEPNVEVRLFNPFPFRTVKQLGFLTDFSRLNRRMHNKSITVDGQITIVGGRNIGDEYFGATKGVAFADLDVMVAGNIVDDVSQDFDLYWNSQSSYPIELLVKIPKPNKAQTLLQEEETAALSPKAFAYIQTLEQSDLIQKLLASSLEFQWVPVSMVSDDPAKVLGKAQPETMLTARLTEILDQPVQSVDLISPYFVPTQQGVQAFGALADQGVQVRILTNAMEATDVIAVHAGYSKYRVPLLKRGIELFEMRRDTTIQKPKEKAGLFGSSGSSLHAKTFAVDEKRVFVGSFNFDPRSASLNTELGFVIESPPMALAISDAFHNTIPQNAYKLELNEKNKLIWLDHSSGNTIKLTKEPSTSFWKKLYLGFLSWLPIEWLL